MGQHTGELAGLVQSGSQNTRDLLDQGVGGEEGVVLLGQLLHQLLVLVELLESVGVHAGEAVGLGLVAMLLITQDADGELGTGSVLQPIEKKNLKLNQSSGGSINFRITCRQRHRATFRGKRKLSTAPKKRNSSSQYLRPWVEVRFRFHMNHSVMPEATEKLPFTVFSNEPDGAGETLVLLGIVVLQTDLQVHGLHELAGFVLGALEDMVDSLVESIPSNLRPEKKSR